MTSIIFPDEAEAFLTKAIKQVKIRKAVINCILFNNNLKIASDIKLRNYKLQHLLENFG